MLRDPQYLLDILEAARLACGYLAGKTEEEFYHDVEKQDAVIRRLEIIGEAARRISEETKNTMPDLPWKEMVGMRNFLVHEYDGVDVSVVWDTVQVHLPKVIKILERLSL